MTSLASRRRRQEWVKEEANTNRNDKLVSTPSDVVGIIPAMMTELPTFHTRNRYNDFKKCNVSIVTYSQVVWYGGEQYTVYLLVEHKIDRLWRRRIVRAIKDVYFLEPDYRPKIYGQSFRINNGNIMGHRLRFALSLCYNFHGLVESLQAKDIVLV